MYHESVPEEPGSPENAGQTAFVATPATVNFASTTMDISLQ
jgi:hypothetical protein